MKTIGIIGAGFSGTMTAVQLIKNSNSPFEIILINERDTLNKGFAYNPYSDKHLLNVITGKMSAYSNMPDDFLDWVMQKDSFKEKDRTLIANSFLPRQLYGEYLVDIWKNYAAIAASKNITITIIDSFVVDLEPQNDKVTLWLDNDEKFVVDNCIIASGNLVPRNPKIKNTNFYPNKNYFQNPWTIDSVQNINPKLPVLIVGNGLTMVDTVVALMEQGFKNDIYSISPNGFNILPHRHNGLKYTKLTEELKDNMSLFEVFKLVKKHIKMAREYGATAEPVIDSLRPFTQSMWKRFTAEEKSIFMSKLRHLWGVARHRIPIHTHDKLQKLRIDGKLHINSGKILNFTEDKDGIIVEYFDKKDQSSKTLKVSRIINCTGPETDLNNVENSFLKNCLLKGILTQDPLKLGIKTNTDTYQVINADGKPHSNLFTLGGNLKGELWESTAVNELKIQTENLGELLKVQSDTTISQPSNVL